MTRLQLANVAIAIDITRQQPMPEAYLEPSRISMVGLFAKITAKSYIIDVLLVFK